MAKKLLKITPPKIRLTTKGVKVSNARARVRGPINTNISRSGVSHSVTTRAGTYNTKKGCSRVLPGCPLTILVLFGMLSLPIWIIILH